MPFKTWSPGDVLTAADVNAYLMRQTKAVCTSGSRPSSPVTGQEIFETDTKQTNRWDGTAWRLWPPVPVQFDESTIFTFTNTTYAAGATQCSGTFVAGPAGVAVVTAQSNLQAAAGGYGLVSFEIRTGTTSSDPLFLAAVDNNAFGVQDIYNNQAGMTTVVTGMTGGTTYFIRTMHRSITGGTGTINFRRLVVIPWAN